MHRRQLLRAVGAAATAALAGCAGGERSLIPPGERRTAGGFAVAVTRVVRRDAVALRRSSEGTATTVLEAGADAAADARFLAAALRLENVTDDPRDLPAPGSGPNVAGGTISITDTDGMYNEDFPEEYRGEFVVDGAAAPMYWRRCEDEDWWLAPGESVHGWLVFLVGRDFDTATRPLTVDFEGARLHFSLAPATATSTLPPGTSVEE